MSKIEIAKHLKLPFQFDVQKLKEDLNHVFKSDWIAHFNTPGYTGKWTSIALYAPNGDQNNVFATQKNRSPLQETSLIQNSNYFKKVLSYFECPLLSVRLLNLGVGAFIKPHKDHELGYENGCFRLHIPIHTNPNVEFILAGTSLTMLPGECWYTNVNYTHSVANNGNEDRIHLVIDGLRNEWSDNLFFSLTTKESLLTIEPIIPDSISIARTIEELERAKIPGYKEIIENFKERLKNTE